MKFETARLLLRPWQAEDAAWLYEYAKDPAVGPSAGWPAHRDLEESHALICTALNGPACYAICEKACGHPIGTIELKLPGKTELTARATECELGYWLGRAFWGRGIMTKAVEEMCRTGFEAWDIVRIYAEPFAHNAGSRRVLEKAGFALEGVMRSGIWKNGRLRDYCMYALLRPETQ